MTAARLLVGDVFERMAELPDHSFDLILTSPPFLALRSYLPDGHPDKHKEIGSEATPAEFLDTLLELTAVWRRLLAPHGSIAIELGDTYAGSGGAGGDYNDGNLRTGQNRFDGSSSRGRITGRGERHHESGHAAGIPHASNTQAPIPTKGPGWPLDKSLTGIPTLYTWSLAYGRNLLTGQPSPAGMWRIRNLKPWIRSNPPVGALGDKERPATSYITVATIARDRWFDLDAVRTAYTTPDTRADVRYPRQMNGRLGTDGENGESANGNNPAGAPPLDWFVDVDAVIDAEIDRRAGKLSSNHPEPAGKPIDRGRIGTGDGGHPRSSAGTHTVGARGVHIRRALENAGILTTLDALDVSPKGYAGAHYAVWPKELCRLLIDEMCPRKVCTVCGEPSRRIVGDVEYRKPDGRPHEFHGDGFEAASGEAAVERRKIQAAGGDVPHRRKVTGHDNGNMTAVRPTVGWSDCNCPETELELPCNDTNILGDDNEIRSCRLPRGHLGTCKFSEDLPVLGYRSKWRPGHVLDPFAGSGTTLAVATGMARDCTGIDLDPRNADLARERCGMFLEIDWGTNTTERPA